MIRVIRLINKFELFTENWSYSYDINDFRYIPDNEIVGDILGWTPSFTDYQIFQLSYCLQIYFPFFVLSMDEDS